jgi:hypothetical protein
MITGVVLWLDLDLSRTLADLVSNVRESLSWFVIGELGVHVVVAWRETYERRRALLDLSPLGKGDHDGVFHWSPRARRRDTRRR